MSVQMPGRGLRKERQRQRIENVRVADTLLYGPYTLEEIEHRSFSYRIPLSLFKITTGVSRVTVFERVVVEDENK
jgi:hypothetical protein